MGETGTIVFALLVSISAGLWTHALAKRRRWLFAVGVLAVCVGFGVTCYAVALAANGWDGLLWAIAALLGGLPASVGAGIGIATGAWAGRKA